MAERMLSIALQDGLEGDRVVVRIGDDPVIDQSAVRTDQRIGLAYAIDVPRPAGSFTLAVELPERGLHATKDFASDSPAFVGISVLDDRVVITASEVPFGYA